MTSSDGGGHDQAGDGGEDDDGGDCGHGDRYPDVELGPRRSHRQEVCGVTLTSSDTSLVDAQKHQDMGMGIREQEHQDMGMGISSATLTSSDTSLVKAQEGQDMAGHTDQQKDGNEGVKRPERLRKKRDKFDF